MCFDGKRMIFLNARLVLSQIEAVVCISKAGNKVVFAGAGCWNGLNIGSFEGSVS